MSGHRETFRRLCAQRGPFLGTNLCKAGFLQGVVKLENDSEGIYDIYNISAAGVQGLFNGEG